MLIDSTLIYLLPHHPDSTIISIEPITLFSLFGPTHVLVSYWI